MRAVRKHSEGAMTKSEQPKVSLNDGRTMPQFGLGVFQTPPDSTEEIVRMAVEEGYRLVDTAAMYRNEEGVGRTLHDRPDVFITTKLGNSDHGLDETLRAFALSARKLGRDPLDSTSSIGRARGSTAMSRAGRRWSVCKNRAGSARSASRISIAITSSGSSAKRALRPPSIRSSFIPAFSRRR